MMMLGCAAGLACGDSEPSTAPPPPVSEHDRAPLYRVGGEEDPALFRLGLGARRHQGELVSALESLNAAQMSHTQRIVIQNDVWGLLDRLGPETSVLTRAARAAVTRLALPASAFSETERTLPPELEGFVERASELPTLQHERAYHLRRLFGLAFRSDEHVIERPSTRALFSRLVAVDDAGRRHLTSVVGEIEWLRFEGAQLREARVWKLSRRDFELEETHVVEHVPDSGADSFVFDFGTPTPLSDLPCQRCHDDDAMMSLPNATLALGWRDDTLLAGPDDAAVELR
jgi:hypothetical protein